jgi:putative NADH-flavin reductase
VTIVNGDIEDTAAVRAAVVREHVIVSALGGGSLAAPGTALSVGTANLVAAARAHGVQRILAVVGAGVLQADETRLRNELPGYPPQLVAISREHLAVYRALRDSALDWTLVCAPNIVDGPATGQCTATADYLPSGAGRVTTGDIAALWLRAAEMPSFSRTRVGVNTSYTT